MTIHVGIDVGGTFTDAVAVSRAGSVRGKSLSTSDVTGGILGALGVLQQRLGMSNDEFFDQVTRFVLSNTIVTNAIDQLKFAKVGLLTTRGFKDTLRIARSARGEERDPHDLAPYPSVVERQHIAEISERVDAQGRELVPVDLAEVKEALAELVENEGVEALAVCFLWSFRNSAHEKAVGDLIRSSYPNLPFTLSSELTPVYREYERMATTVLDAAVKPIVADHFVHLEQQLRDAGLRVAPQIMQVHGGFLSVRETSRAPINMFNSGPVGGVAGARLLGRRIGCERILTADMGGTSLDAFVERDNIDAAARELQEPNAQGLILRADDVFHSWLGGGGGLGDPLLRDPRLVVQDVRDEFVSPNYATDVYGVVLSDSPEGFASDATTARRQQIRAARLNDSGGTGELRELVNPQPDLIEDVLIPTRRDGGAWTCPACTGDLGNGEDWLDAALHRSYGAFDRLTGVGVRLRERPNDGVEVRMDEYLCPSCATLLHASIRVASTN